MTYASHWGLRESPFGGMPRGEFVYASPAHQEALARLQFLVDHRRRLGIVSGAAGCGKSLLLRVFGDQLRRKGIPFALVNLLGIDVREWLVACGDQWGTGIRGNSPDFAAWRQIVDHLKQFHYQQQPVVLLCDDADEATPEMMQALERLQLIESTHDSNLITVLACRPQRFTALAPRLVERSELLIELEPWNADEVASFLADGLGKAGGKSDSFAPSAAARLHELTAGIPRHVRKLADLSLLAAAGQSQPRIEPETIDAVCEELSPSGTGRRPVVRA